MAKAPEQYDINMKLSVLDPILEQMEDKHFDSHMIRTKNYTTIINSFDESSDLDDDTTERLLTICHKDLIRDLQYSSSAIMVITLILKKIKDGKCEYPAEKLLQSALILVRITKKLLTKTLLRKIGFEAIIAYPKETLVALVDLYSEAIIDLIDYHPELNYQTDITCWISSLIIRLLEILPYRKKLDFVKKGLNAWFNTFIPGVMTAYMAEDGTTTKTAIAALELLTESLKEVDYIDNSKWQVVLKDICDHKRYPLLLKSSLEKGRDNWHTLWKIFIKLLKDQITKVNKTGASPINALLPVVEQAFKMEPLYRCKAFECWNVLIDNFSTELNESLVDKRLKLLMIPLKLHNAKVEETVVAKFNTWWHLIRCFHGKMDRFTDTILIPFLHFCFGKPGLEMTKTGKSVINAGQMSNLLALKVIEALVEVVGHVDCTGCGSLPSVNGRLISTKLLVEHWSLWIHTLQATMKTASENYGEPVIKKIRCLWKGFVMVIAELPDNQIRADLVMELLKCVGAFLELKINKERELITVPSRHNDNVSALVFEIIVSAFLDENPKIRSLLKKQQMFILRIVQSAHMDTYFSRNFKNVEDKISKLKPVAALIMDSSITDTDQVLKMWIAQPSFMLDSNVLMWAAIVDAIFDTQRNLKTLPQSIHEFILMPLTTEELENEYDSETIWYRWYKLYNSVYPAIRSAKLDDEIAKVLTSQVPCKTLKLAASIAILKQKLVSDKNEFLKAAQMLLDILSNTHDFLDAFFPILTDTLLLLMNKVRVNSSTDLIKVTIMLLQVTLKCINMSLKEKKDAKKPIYVDTLQDGSRKFLDKLSKNQNYASLKTDIANTYKIKAEIDHTVNSRSNSSKEISISATDEAKSVDNEKSAERKEVSDKTNFTTPQPKSAKKTKTNKKEPNIVNTVVENGEEFVVVKSHWKFNPRKLTENQKEKFKRKREDIPALYQDLSQSQDEFKLTTWKTDSQDASTSTSKSESNSKTNDDVAVILKKMPNTEVVPKIIENIFTDPANKSKEITSEKSYNDNNNKLEKTPTAKDPKTPRLALKDRVFRNVRNLIEKSGLQGDGKITNQVVEDANQTVAIVNENDLNTPISKVKTVVNAANSAPPKLTTERPTRAIKKPKKFEDTEIFALKKKRRSNSTAPSDSQSDQDTPDVEKEKETAKDQMPISMEGGDIKEQENIIKDTKTITEIKNDDHPKPPLQDVADAEAPPTHIEDAVTTSTQKEKTPPTEHDNFDHIESINDSVVIEECKTPDKEEPINTNINNSSQVIEEVSTPKPYKTNKDEIPSTIKKKRSRIEKQLLIDMVEGHPVLQQSQPEKRVTRKNVTAETKDTMSKRKKSLIEKSNKIKAELVNAGILEVLTTEKTKPESKSSSPKSAQNKKAVTQQQTEQASQSVTIVDSQENSFESQDIAMSEDVIESSQDSTLTTISVKSATKKKVPIVCLDKENVLVESSPSAKKKLIDDFNSEVIPLSDTLNDICNQTGAEDIELPKNKTMPEESAEVDLTENMDTEPMDSSGEVIIINDEVATPIVINTEETVIGKETQEMAEADTLPMDVDGQSIPPTDEAANNTASKLTLTAKPADDNDITNVPTQEDMTPTLSGPAEVVTDIIVESSNTGSPLKDEIQRKKDFLNDTIEISPIKTLSPVREKKSPSPETSSDYVVIKLTSPVQSNGEPYSEKCDSPEVFTEDKVSPDKRDQSPPRKEVAPANSSPSSSLSLKKNRPQMRFNGRAAQMLGLCVPEKLQILNTERSENDEGRKSSSVSTPARRNLKRFYADNENQANENESEESENFLKFTRPLPAAESSPATPILKRKLAEIADECTVSPASKRKRVSFHDPPVSTTVAVQKYIEPCGIRSPSNSAIKRQERQFRALTNAKSPKRLDNVFRLETVLTKAVESFSDENTVSNDTEMSLDETPAAEVVKTSELNDTDPICPELLDCKDPIEIIAGELSSPSTKALLIKELEGEVETVADLAKMTELEVNRLCIKAPKVQVAKKVLSKYASEKAKSQEIIETPIVAASEEIDVTSAPIVVAEIEKAHNESQTDEVLTKNSEMQTIEVTKALVHTQTDAVPTVHCGAQTNESGSKSTKDIVSTCLKERPDFVDQLMDQLPFDTCLSLALNKMTPSNSNDALNKVLSQTSKRSPKEANSMDLKILQDHLCKRLDANELISFCGELFRKFHDKTP